MVRKVITLKDEVITADEFIDRLPTEILLTVVKEIFSGDKDQEDESYISFFIREFDETKVVQ